MYRRNAGESDSESAVVESKEREEKGRSAETPGGGEKKTKNAALYLVSGGRGFLGRHMVDALLRRGMRVRIFDNKKATREELPAGLESYACGDLCAYEDVVSACEGVHCVFHMAAVTDPWAQPHLYERVNVEGTAHLIRACLEAGVRQLIYTSSSAVVLDGQDCQDGDESMSYPSRHLDAFSFSKCRAEKLVLGSNGAKGRAGVRLATCALRPHNVFGPGDTHFVYQLMAKGHEGDITHMIGEGHNVADFTYVANVVHGHVLVSQRLGSYEQKPAGQVYFVTNGEPTMFWSFLIKMLKGVGCNAPTKNISFNVAYILACIMEFIYWLFGWMVGWKPVLTRQMVVFMGCHHYFSHAKASQDFGYCPIVTLEEGMRLTIEHFLRHHKASKRIEAQSDASAKFTATKQ